MARQNIHQRQTVMVERKAKLMILAKDGKEKPLERGSGEEHNLSRSLRRFTSTSYKVYDVNFDRKIRKLRPEWFIPSSKLKKEKLLKMASSGCKRPSSASDNKETRSLGTALIVYTNSNAVSYDRKFSFRIKQERPDWFQDTVKVKKDKLLKLAANGDERPNKRSKNDSERSLGLALRDYVNANSSRYDEEFCTKIKKISPNWFII